MTSSLLMNLILASTSPYRRIQLKSLGIPFTAMAPKTNESRLKKVFHQLEPKQLAARLAYEKAKSIQKTEAFAIIIGADQLVSFNNKILGKPGNARNAFKMLKSLSGKDHLLITSFVILYKNKTYKRSVVAKIRLRHLTDKEIYKYVNRDKPFDCAGSYKFEKSGYSLIEKMHVSDPSSLIGLPLIELNRVLQKIIRS